MNYLSVSQINSYLLCPLKYRFQYVDQIPKPFKSSALAFGSAVHSAIAWWHRRRMRGIDVSEKELLGIFRCDWYVQCLDPIRFKPKETEEELVEKATALLKLYTGTFDSQVPKEAELFFEVPLVNLETGETLDVPLRGFIDLIDQEDTVVEIKTTARSLDKRSFRQHLQLTAYAYAYWMLFDKIPQLKLVSLIKTKRPRIEVLVGKRGSEEFTRFFFLGREVLKGITEGIFYPNEGWQCDGCEYLDVCQRWRPF